MKFMTGATLQNMPTYLADARARRAGEDADKERERKEAMQKRLQKLGQTFMASGDFTAKGLQKFAQENQMSMPEMNGMVKMVTNFKQLEKQNAAKAPSLINTRPEGAGYTERTVDAPGVKTFDKPPAPGGAGTGKEKMADWMRFGVNTLKGSLGQGDMVDWTDAKQKKYNAVLTDYGNQMKKPGANMDSAFNELFGAVDRYDSSVSVAKTVSDIPEDTALITVSDAKEQVAVAVAAGALPDDIRKELTAKGWSEKKITAILGQAPSTAKATTTSRANPLNL